MSRIRHHVNPFSVRHEVHFKGFADANPIIVDVGACKGVFAKRVKKMLPEHNLLLCEIRKPLVKQLKNQFLNEPRVRIFDGDAAKNLHNLLLPSIKKSIKIEDIFINFPDPWPKKAHHKRRFITPGFLVNLSEWLPNSVPVTFQTDFKPLFDDTVGYVLQSPFRRIHHFSDSPHGCQTHWEEQKIAESAAIYRMKFWKN